MCSLTSSHQQVLFLHANSRYSVEEKCIFCSRLKHFEQVVLFKLLFSVLRKALYNPQLQKEEDSSG